MDIKIISYNILSDILATEYLLVDKKYLDNKHRMKLLLQKLEKEVTNNTIICLQETYSTQLNILIPWFAKKNFVCVSHGDLATFYNVNEFRIKQLDMGKIKDIKSIINSSRHNGLIESRNHSFIIAVFTKKEKEFTVGNTHLVSAPELDKLKILQTYILSKRLINYKNVVLTGDFNSKPTSQAYKVLSTGTLQNKKIRKLYSTQVAANKVEPVATTYTSTQKTPDFLATLDYIWVDEDIKVLNAKKIGDITKDGLLPNATEGSDHILIHANIKIK
jgi:mRNA deadenylase 3'-5' endonuclease subunit Ccr4